MSVHGEIAFVIFMGKGGYLPLNYYTTDLIWLLIRWATLYAFPLSLRYTVVALRLGKKRANEIIRLKGKEIIFRVCVCRPTASCPPGVAMKR